MNFVQRKFLKWNTISISGYHIREAGSTAAQEVGFTLANGIAYVDAAIKAGLDVDTFGQRFHSSSIHITICWKKLQNLELPEDYGQKL